MIKEALVKVEDVPNLAAAIAQLQMRLPDGFPRVRVRRWARTGQVTCTVVLIQRTGTTEAEAMEKVAEALR